MTFEDILTAFQLIFSADFPDKIFHGEEDDDDVVNDLDYGDYQRVLGGARLRGLQLLDGGEDEGEGGHHDHEEADEGHDLGKLARPWVLERVPGPGPPLQTHNTHM